MRGWLSKALIVAACVAYQVLVHGALSESTSASARLVLAAVPLVVFGWWIAFFAARKALWATVLVAIAAGVLIAERLGHLGLAAENGLTHAAINAAMLWVFSRTLTRGREPLVTRFARRFHGTLAPEIERYTRAVTIAWCAFFAAQLVASAVLFIFAPLATWSLFVTVLSLPLVVAMFVGEYAYRSVRYRNLRHANIIKSIELFIEDARRARRARMALARRARFDGHA